MKVYYVPVPQMAKTLVQAGMTGDSQSWWGEALEEKVCVVVVGPRDVGPEGELLPAILQEASDSILGLMIGGTDGTN